MRDASAQLDRSLPTVLAAHLTVQGAEISGSERTSLIAHEPKFTVAQLAQPGIDYVALGHIHKRQDRNEGQHPPVVYSSSIERISFKEHDAQKGFVLVTIDPAQTTPEARTRFEYVDTPARVFLPLDIDAREAGRRPDGPHPAPDRQSGRSRMPSFACATRSKNYKYL